MKVLLASSSPRRRQLLSRLGLEFEVVPSRVVERPPEPGEDAGSYALSLAAEKASEVAGRRPGAVVIGADTVVVADGVILGKPEDEADAMRMLRLLAGKWHRVVTGVVVECGSRLTGAESAEVLMRHTGDDERAAYIASGEPMDKAGAYAIQGDGRALVERVRGCRETVVGLPLCLLSDLLRECGLQVTAEPGCEHFQ